MAFIVIKGGTFMIKTYYSKIVSRQQVKSSDNEFNCYAYETANGEYYLMYHLKSCENKAYISDEPIEKDKIEFIGQKEIFETPFMMLTRSEIIH